MITITKKDIAFAIVSKNDTEVYIVVRYFVPGFDFNIRLNLQLPINYDTMTVPTGQDLTDFILAHAPVDALQEQVSRYHAAPMVDLSHIDDMIEHEDVLMPAPMFQKP